MAPSSPAPRHTDSRAGQDLLSSHAAQLAHEFKSPLVVMGGLARSLHRGKHLPQEDRHKLKIIQEECLRLERLVRDVLQLSTPLQAEPSGADVVELVRETMEVLGHRRRPHPVRLVLLPINRVTVAAPRDTVRQCLQNLMGNGLDAMRQQGMLSVKVAAVGAQAEISVRDTGVGMTPLEVSRAFEPFHTTKPDGTGLGLPLTRSLAEAVGGSLELVSQPDKGTTAILRLPLVRFGGPVLGRSA